MIVPNGKMTLPTFIQKLNWRQMLMHFVATWFFIYSFRQLAFLTNVKKYQAVQILIYSGESKFSEFLKHTNFTFAQVITYFFYANDAWLIGLLVAFVISLIIAKRWKWFWVNSLIVLLVVFTLKRLDFLGWSYLKEIFLEPGHLFHNTALYLLVNGLVLLALGIFVFFYGPFNNFIDNNRLVFVDH